MSISINYNLRFSFYVPEEQACGYCPNGWQHYLDKCYRYFNQKLDWYQAKKACENEDAALIVINTVDEFYVLKNYLKSYSAFSLLHVLLFISETIWVNNF